MSSLGATKNHEPETVPCSSLITGHSLSMPCLVWTIDFGPLTLDYGLMTPDSRLPFQLHELHELIDGCLFPCYDSFSEFDK